MFTEIMPKEFFKSVQDFMRITEANRDFVWWAEMLIAEETKELIKADVENEGMGQIFKESADLFYVVAGFHNCMPSEPHKLLSDEKNREIQDILDNAWNTLAQISTKFSIPILIFEQAFNVVHLSNMSKLDDDGNPIRRVDGKILKGPNYLPPDMSEVVKIWENSLASKTETKNSENTNDNPKTSN